MIFIDVIYPLDGLSPWQITSTFSIWRHSEKVIGKSWKRTKNHLCHSNSKKKKNLLSFKFLCAFSAFNFDILIFIRSTFFQCVCAYSQMRISLDITIYQHMNFSTIRRISESIRFLSIASVSTVSNPHISDWLLRKMNFWHIEYYVDLSRLVCVSNIFLDRKRRRKYQQWMRNISVKKSNIS